MTADRRLALSAALTGFAGLGSETLYFKLLDQTVGAAPLVVFTVVAVFIVGMGAGGLLSARVRRPARIELALAAYNLGWLLLHPQLRRASGAALERLIPLLGASAGPALLGAIFVAPAAVLLGVTFPALSEHGGAAAPPYRWQAVGAALGVLIMEAVLYPSVGLSGTLGALVAVHLATAALLTRLEVRFEPAPVGRPPLLLSLAGGASGAVQGVWLLLAALLAGPGYFVQPTVVLASVLGIFVGAAAWMRWRFDFGRALASCAVGLAASSALAAGFARAPPPEGPIASALLLALCVLPASTPIGALLPAWWGSRSRRTEVGGALLGLAIGNGVGVMAAAALLALVGPGPVIAGLGLAFAGLAVAAGARRAAWAGLLPLAVAPALGLAPFVARLPVNGGQPVELEAVFRGPGEISAVYRVPLADRVVRRLYQNGFSPIELSKGAEAKIGLVGAAYAPRGGSALVIGAGSGRTAGTIAAGFERTDVLDIGVTVRALLRYLDRENLGLLGRPGVRYWELDALLAAEVLRPGYDLIVLTVDPGFHGKAYKLYSLEYLETLRGLLAPDGVLIFWADDSLTAEGVQTLWNTGRAAFAHQRAFLAFAGPSKRRKTGYHFLVHGQGPLVHDPHRPHLLRMIEAAPELAGPARELSEEVAQVPAEGCVHATRRVHHLSRPARALIFSGRNEHERVKVQLSCPD